MAGTKNTKKDMRTRNWTFIVYPDSAPENWRDILDDLHVPWVESPLHDKDINADGTEKKAHWHVMMLFSSNKTYDQIREITLPLKCPNPMKVASAKSMVRYFAHIDNPEKVQYDKKDIIAHGGAEIENYLTTTRSERYEIIRDMMNFVDEQGITEIKSLLDYARSQKFDEWFPLLCDNSLYVMDSYIRSNRHSTVTSKNNVDVLEWNEKEN